MVQTVPALENFTGIHSTDIWGLVHIRTRFRSFLLAFAHRQGRGWRRRRGSLGYLFSAMHFLVGDEACCSGGIHSSSIYRSRQRKTPLQSFFLPTPSTAGKKSCTHARKRRKACPAWWPRTAVKKWDVSYLVSTRGEHQIYAKQKLQGERKFDTFRHLYSRRRPKHVRSGSRLLNGDFSRPCHISFDGWDWVMNPRSESLRCCRHLITYQRCAEKCLAIFY